jgi:hypothetical protein
VAVTAAYGNGDEVLFFICRCSLSLDKNTRLLILGIK